MTSLRRLTALALLVALASGVLHGQAQTYFWVRRPSRAVYGATDPGPRLAPTNGWCITQHTSGSNPGYLHAVFTAKDNNVWRVYYAQSQDSGWTWETPVQVSHDDVVTDDAMDGVIACYVDTLAVAYYHDDSDHSYPPNIFSRESWNLGTEWKHTHRLSYLGDTDHEDADHPSIAIGMYDDDTEGRAWIAYQDDTKYDDLPGEYISRNWVKLREYVATNVKRKAGDRDSDYPSVAVQPDAHTVHVAYQFHENGWDIYYNDSRTANSTPEAVTATEDADRHPTIQYWLGNENPDRDDTLCIVYQRSDYEPGAKRYLRCTYAAEATQNKPWSTNDHEVFDDWEPPDDGEMVHPNMWYRGDTLYLVFSLHYVEDGENRSRVYFTFSADCGASWYEPPVKVSAQTCDSASVFGNGEHVYIVYRHHYSSKPTRSKISCKVLAQLWYLAPDSRSPSQARVLGERFSGQGDLYRATVVNGFVSCSRSRDNGASWEDMGSPGWGSRPALAVDGDSTPLIVFVCDDTVYCSWWDHECEEWGEPLVIFEGASGAVPGQPSARLYPGLSAGVKVAAVVFPVYVSGSSETMALFAKVDTGNVLLDTIETHSSLADSGFCINIYQSDSLFVTWERNSAVASSEMPDLAKGTWSQPASPWSTPDTVDASGLHPYSYMEGNYLHCVWKERYFDGEVEDTVEVIKTASYDVSGNGPLYGWQAGSDPSETDTRLKTNPVRAGAGVTLWQEKVSGIWRIMAEVRGDTMTLITADSSCLNPHPLAESSQVSPSISQIRIKTLYYEAFKIDSCTLAFRVDSLNVSNAGSDATESNNGSKLLRKPNSDSLFACYQDADGAVMYAWSADGSAWQRRQCANHGTYPALAADGTGRRWVVCWDEPAGKVYARFDSSGTFSSAKELCDLQADQCGPISAAGSHHPSTSCAYAAFRRIKDGQVDQVILAKFDATNQNTTAVLEGDQYVHPCVGTEWVSGDSKDHVHLCWENADENEVYYKMTSSTVDPAEAAPSYSWEDDYNLSSSEDDSKDPSMHVSDSRVVVAWSEHSTYDVVAARRDLEDDYDDFEDTVNLSQSAVNSLYPVVYDADSCIVAWEEHSSEGDIDIFASVEFETGFCMVDNAGESRYPHCLFQNKASGDTAIPYVHLIYCEEPEDNYYEVGYKAWNLKAEGGGGGGQSGGVQQLLTPMLSACRPNPFSARTLISYQFPHDGPVNLRVFDASGRSVKTLQKGLQRAGKYTVTWDGRDQNGRNVANGVYFYRFDAPGFRDVKKAVVMK